MSGRLLRDFRILALLRHYLRGAGIVTRIHGAVVVTDPLTRGSFTLAWPARLPEEFAESQAWSLARRYLKWLTLSDTITAAGLRQRVESGAPW